MKTFSSFAARISSPEHAEYAAQHPILLSCCDPDQEGLYVIIPFYDFLAATGHLPGAKGLAARGIPKATRAVDRIEKVESDKIACGHPEANGFVQGDGGAPL